MKEQGIPNDPVVLRKEIGAILDKVTNRGSLLFFQWLIRNIDKELQSPDELKKLHQVFIRVIDAFQHKALKPCRFQGSGNWPMH